jgi:hypothetical protein
MNWTVYLSGEIHTDWRQQIMQGAKLLDLPVTFTSAVTNHEASDGMRRLMRAIVLRLASLISPCTTRKLFTR